MGNLIAESKRLINSSISQNTYKAYRATLNKFQLFLNIYGLQQTWPLHSNILLYFIAYLSIQKMSPNSVYLYISALSYFHKINHLLTLQSQQSTSRLKAQQQSCSRQPPPNNPTNFWKACYIATVSVLLYLRGQTVHMYFYISILCITSCWGIHFSQLKHTEFIQLHTTKTHSSTSTQALFKVNHTTLQNWPGW